MARYILDLPEDIRVKLEEHRKRLGLRSGAETVRALISGAGVDRHHEMAGDIAKIETGFGDIAITADPAMRPGTVLALPARPKPGVGGLMTGAQLARAQGLTVETEAAAREASAALSDLTDMFDEDDYEPTEVVEPFEDGWTTPRGRGRRK